MARPAAEVWEFIKRNKFLGMIIPKEYGGLGFSPYAHSEVVRKISSRSVTAAVTVMVPNSLGPGELLMHFGTKEQRDKWLPGLAEGSEIPCFGLTSPEAGSDAASMIDTGIICKGTFNGKETLGLRLNWHKRYITLGPVATLLGLAFKAYDPDHLIGSEEELGITVALIPTDLPGVSIGRRHLPAMQVFQNGPNWGKDVFIPMDFIIGGQERIGQGWKMLMTALAAGRGISLPSQSSRWCGVLRARHRRLRAYPRTIQGPDRKIRGHRGAAGAHRRHGLSARCRAAADLRCAQSGHSSGGGLRHHEAACHRAPAHHRRRCDGYSLRQGRHRRAAELHGQSLPLGARSPSRSKARTS